MSFTEVPYKNMGEGLFTGTEIHCQGMGDSLQKHTPNKVQAAEQAGEWSEPLRQLS